MPAARRFCPILLVALVLPLLHWPAARAEDPGTAAPSVTIPEDLDKRMQEEADRVRKQLQNEAKSLFQRTPLGFDLDTLDRLRQWVVSLPMKTPALIRHFLEQGRLLGILGSLVVLAFLATVIYSLAGQSRVLRRCERALDPWQERIPKPLYPYLISLIKVVVASLIPLLLFGAYTLIQAFFSYRAPGFLLAGQLLKLWALGALILNLLRESLTRDLLPVPSRFGVPVFRVARFVTLFILACVAVFWGAKAYQIPRDSLALLRFCISVAIVVVVFLFLLKKKTLIGLLPELPYRPYQTVRGGLEHYYYPLLLLTLATGLLRSAGYRALCDSVWTRLWGTIGAFFAITFVYHFLQGWLRRWVAERLAANPRALPLHRSMHGLLLYTTVSAALLLTLDLTGLLSLFQTVFSFPILTVGHTDLSLWVLVKAIFILLAFIFFSRLIRAFMDYRVYPAIGVDEGLAYAVNTFLNYSLFLLGLFFSLRAVGLDFRVLMVFAGAIGIGVGLGLQSTAANLISGFSLVFGRRLRKGDLISVGAAAGQVEEVGLRTTRLTNGDNLEYLIPNSELTANTIVNYSLSDPLVRLHVPVGVSYNAEPRAVERILLELAAANPSVSGQKAPQVWFTEFGESSLNFELLVWVDVRRVPQKEVLSELNHAIFEALSRAGIEIPYPQRDVHIRSGLHRPAGGEAQGKGLPVPAAGG